MKDESNENSPRVAPIYMYKLLNRIYPLCKNVSLFFFSLSPSFFTLKYDHSNIAIHMWHPLSDESSLTSPPSSYMKHAATPKGRGSCSNIVEYQFFPKLQKFFRFYYYLSIPPRGFLSRRFFFYIVLRIVCNFFYLKRVKLIYFNRE